MSQPTTEPVRETQPSKQPPKNKFFQQELPAWKPLLTPGWVLFCLSSVALIFIPTGAICLHAALSVVEVTHRYDTCIEGVDASARGAALSAANGQGIHCPEVNITIPDDMYGPVFIYYQLENYFQNHRRYVKSRSSKQLQGDEVGEGDTGDCAPQQFLGDNSSLLINPCGLIAWSLFNDTYQIQSCNWSYCEANETLVPIVSRGIAWDSDRERKFGDHVAENFNTDPALRGGATIDGPIQADERFLVWMRTATLSTFRKLWGVVPAPPSGPTFHAGETLKLDIQNRYNTYSFDGSKTVILSTANWLGGKNTFLGIAFLTVGCLSALLAAGFLLFRMLKPRRLGDIAYLSWNKCPAAEDAPNASSS
mmetsp:Transcript_519/g.887  ORF Transcript_519/g.887 Transcript_519/m.887 type:complete len:365 (-) Transcript_519:72-1166(-)|eukprot:CAMPEP_0177760684 /NCGR_PEP_ID=MMETSP0491_2-20121128/5395_1 /TAXON_ID=63592 /ORGANISM="Tetraselmis chuii, Strain PLY429" /LENGTH=364 /DNA_ID=CAMNT_0019276593 /DNA_START=201 /DNA_END=1295 /DNA_ORIENTATION=-